MEGKRQGAGLSRVGAIARERDPERFLAALFAPPGPREALFALLAFNWEVAKTREMVSEPILGHMRLQWWRDTIAGIYDGAAVRRHEVAEPLAAAVRAHALGRAPLDGIVDAREADLEDRPFPDMAALESYAAATSGGLARSMLEALGAPEASNAGTEVATAWGLVGLLRALPFHARARRLMLPADLVAETGLATRDLFELRSSPALAAAVRRVAERGRALLEQARRRPVPRAALPVLLIAPLADRHLGALERAGWDPFAAPARRDPLAALRLAVAHWRGRF